MTDPKQGRHGKSPVAAVGTWIKVREIGADEEEIYQLADVTNIAKAQLAQDNPMGKALVGAQSGDVVTVEGPAGPVRFNVLDVQSQRIG